MKAYWRKYILLRLMKALGTLRTVDLHFCLLIFMKKNLHVVNDL